MKGIITFIAVIIFSIAGYAQDSKTPDENGSYAQVEDKASDFTVQMSDGSKVRLSELRDKVVLINFWATWCPPCMKEFAELPEKIVKPYKNKEFVFLAISRGEEPEKVNAKMDKLKKKGIDFTVGYDPEKEIWSKFAEHSIPKNYLIDKNGVIRYISTGFEKDSLEKLAKEIDKLLAE
jgi:peroxiredoxin